MPEIKRKFHQKVELLAKQILIGTGWEKKVKVINVGDGRAVLRIDNPVSLTLDEKILYNSIPPNEAIKIRLITETKLRIDELNSVIEKLEKEDD